VVCATAELVLSFTHKSRWGQKNEKFVKNEGQNWASGSSYDYLRSYGKM
jgi:hypothetical protein